MAPVGGIPILMIVYAFLTVASRGPQARGFFCGTPLEAPACGAIAPRIPV